MPMHACFACSGQVAIYAKGIPLAKSTWSRMHDPATLNQSASGASCLPGGTEKPISGNAGGLFCAQNQTNNPMQEIQLTNLVSEAIRAPGDFQITYTVEGPTLSRIGSEFSLHITMAEFDRIRTAMDSY